MTIPPVDCTNAPVRLKTTLVLVPGRHRRVGVGVAQGEPIGTYSYVEPNDKITLATISPEAS